MLSRTRDVRRTEPAPVTSVAGSAGAPGASGSLPEAGSPLLGEPVEVSELLGTARVFAIPMTHQFRDITVREGVLLRGPAGWAEFAPFGNYSDEECVPWLLAAIAGATRPWPAPVRASVEVNVTVPVLTPDAAGRLVEASGCRTAKVKVADPRADLRADADRLSAVRAALGPSGHIRIDANGAWTTEQAISAIGRLDRAAGGLEYVEQPCATLAELAAVRRRVRPPIAADESIRHAADPRRVAVAGAADIAVVKVAPLGGVANALRLADLGLPMVVSSALDTSVGLAAGVALAAALPELPYACGLATADLLTGDVTDDPVRPIGGRLAVRRSAPPPNRLERFAADARTTDAWLARLARVGGQLPPL